MSQTPPDLSRLRIERDRPTTQVRRGFRLNLWLFLGALVVVAILALLTRGGGGVEVTTANVEFSGSGGGGGGGLTASGYVEARTTASVSSKISGRLEYLGVSEGDPVKAGQVIARLESADYQALLEQQKAEVALTQATLAESKATREQLRRDLARTEELLKDQVVSNQEAERMRASLEEAEARVSSAEARILVARSGVAVASANLENTYIRAPFDGTVLRRDAELGELVAPSVAGGGLTRGAVATIADLSDLEVEVDVNEAYIGRVSNGQPARVTLDAYPDTTFRGEVRQVMPTADRQRATVQVKVRIVDLDPRILPEMGARVEFTEQGAAGAPARVRILLPAEAAREESGRSYVWLVRGGKLERREVDLGPVSGAKREVRSGLSGGETVVIDGPASLQNGMKVKKAS